VFDSEIIYSLKEARIVIESWRRRCNAERPHGSLVCKPPAPRVFILTFSARVAAKIQSALPPALAQRPTIE